MRNRDAILRIINKELEHAENYDIAEAYADIVGCGECPYWHDCQNERDCHAYIYNKLADKEETHEPSGKRYVVMIKRKDAKDPHSWEEYSGVQHREPIEASLECIEAGKDASVKIARVLVKKGGQEDGK